MKKIGILGSGNVGKTLANGFIKHGYEVKIGTRDVSKLNDWKSKAGAKGAVGSFKEAAEFGEILVLAVKGGIADLVLNTVGAEALKGKIIIDTTNPIADKAPDYGLVQFTTDLNNSMMEAMQASFPAARFVKAFNSVGAHLMVNPAYEQGTPTMFIAGNDKAAKKDVTTILELFGYEAEDLGSVEAARAIEPLCILWCIPGFRENQWGHAFKLLKQ